MNTILIIGTIEAFFLILLLAGKKEKRNSDIYLGVIFLLFTLSIGFTWLEGYSKTHNYSLPWALNVSWLFLFLQGPALWLYIRSMTDFSFRFKKIFLLHLIPFLFFFVIQYISFFSLDRAEKIRIVASESFKQDTFYKISVLAIGIFTTFYNFWGLFLIRDFRKRLVKQFSRIDHIDLSWLRLLIIASLITYGVNVSLFMLDLVFSFASYAMMMLLAYSFASVYIFVLGYFGISQANVFSDRPGDMIRSENIESGQKNKSVPGKSEKEFLNRLLVFMDENQPFLDPEITLSGLAKLMDTKPEILSTVINRQLGQSFFDFINKYRIEEFKIQGLSEKNSHLSLMGIAYECGFNSKAAFYRAFTKFEKLSPGEYIESLRIK